MLALGFSSWLHIRSNWALSTPSNEFGRSIVSDTTETFLLRILQHLAGFVASVLISRGLGPEGRGQYYLLVVTAGLVATLFKFRLEQVNVLLFGRRQVAADRLSGQNGLVAAVMGTMGVALVLLAPVTVPALFGDASTQLWLLAGLTVPFSLHAQLSAGLLALQGRVTWQFRVGSL